MPAPYCLHVGDRTSSVVVSFELDRLISRSRNGYDKQSITELWSNWDGYQKKKVSFLTRSQNGNEVQGLLLVKSCHRIRSAYLKRTPFVAHVPSDMLLYTSVGPRIKFVIIFFGGKDFFLGK